MSVHPFRASPASKHLVPEVSDVDLVDAAKAGDTASFGEIVRRHGPRLLGLARQMVGPEDAEDTVQDAMIDAYRGLGGFIGSAAVGTWLYRIVVSRCLAERRRRRPQVTDGEPLELLLERWKDPRYSVDPELVAIRRSQAETLHAVLDLLPERYRVALILHDGEPFTFSPGQFVGIEQEVKGFGYRRSPYCILSAPTDEPVFELLVRVVPDGPLSHYLGALSIGDVVAFRGPTGRSMVPPEPDKQLVLMATGVGIAPFNALARHLLENGFDQPITIYWGLRLAADICLLDELDELAVHPMFRYFISLSQPTEDWTGLRGRVSESVPPLLATLADRRFYLAGNGMMTEEMALALSDAGADQRFIYAEPYFDGRHRPDSAAVARIRSRFVANDLPSPYRDLKGSAADLEGVLSPGAGTAAPLDASQIFELMPTLLSDHPGGEAAFVNMPGRN